MFFGIVVIAAVYGLFIYGQVSLGGGDNFGQNTLSTNATASYDEFTCMHDSVYEVLLELQYHLSEIHTQLNEQMSNIYSCNSHDLEHEESSENETTTTSEEEEATTTDESSHWEYEFAPGKIVPPEPSPSESTA